MSVDKPEDAGLTVALAEQDCEQTLMTLDGPGIHGVVAVDHHVAQRDLAGEMRDVLKEAEQLCLLNHQYRAERPFGGGEDGE